MPRPSSAHLNPWSDVEEVLDWPDRKTSLKRRVKRVDFNDKTLSAVASGWGARYGMKTPPDMELLALTDILVERLGNLKIAEELEPKRQTKRKTRLNKGKY